MEKEKAEMEFKTLEYRFIQRFKKKPSMEGILLLIGYQESPQLKTSQSKEEKLDLINLGLLTVLSRLGYFRRKNSDSGWPEFEPTDLQVTEAAEEKENLVKRGIVEYFRESDF